MNVVLFEGNLITRINPNRSVNQAAQGNADAQFKLGRMCRMGQGVPQDKVRAHMWFNLAASNFPIVFFGEDREAAVKGRDGVAEKMTWEQILEAQRLAREWKPKSEKAGD